jgi:BirA family transcriptional regulator, biotin operon repressor / biotin---[acetyl-CoA-carboxylase] ligase
VSTDRLATAIEGLPPAWRGTYFAKVKSTQDEASAAARRGAPGRSLFVADYQRAGRGRRGRAWVAPPGTALLVSVLFREATTQAKPWRWTSLASIALVEAIEQLAPELKAAIKWPNDVMLGDRKVAGILAETSWDGRTLQAIVGIGVNVTSTAEELAGFAGATSLWLASRRRVDRADLLLSLTRRIDHWLAQPLDVLHETWQSRLWGRDQRLRLLDVGGEEQDVVVLGADADGALLVRLRDGSTRRTSTGELLP